MEAPVKYFNDFIDFIVSLRLFQRQAVPVGYIFVGLARFLRRVKLVMINWIFPLRGKRSLPENSTLSWAVWKSADSGWIRGCYKVRRLARELSKLLRCSIPLTVKRFYCLKQWIFRLTSGDEKEMRGSSTEDVNCERKIIFRPGCLACFFDKQPSLILADNPNPPCAETTNLYFEVIKHNSWYTTLDQVKHRSGYFLINYKGQFEKSMKNLVI